MKINWKIIKDNLKHLPTTITGIALLLSLAPQDASVQKLLAMSPKVANWVTGTTVVLAALSSIILLGQKIFSKPEDPKTNLDNK